MQHIPYQYQTIDPLILETLNLNERRMNHIFQILHGGKKPTDEKKHIKVNFPATLRQKRRTLSNKQQRSFDLLPKLNDDKKSLLAWDKQQHAQTIQHSANNKIIKKKALSSNSKQNKTFNPQLIALEKGDKSYSQRVNKKNSKNAVQQEQEQSMPKKIYTKRIQRKNDQQNALSQQQRQNRFLLQKYDKLQTVRQVDPSHLKNQLRIGNQQQKKSLAGSRKYPLQKSSFQYGRSQGKKLKKSSVSKANSSDAADEQITLPQVLKNPPNIPYTNRLKTKQMINDYMGNYTLKKSKSLGVMNTKDVYRVQIEQLVSELTPIQKLIDAQKRMKRLKKRYKHLQKFDNKYYSKLNERDLYGL